MWTIKKYLYIFQKIDFLNISDFVMNKNIPKYLKKLIEQYPEIISGRKNYEFFEKRILKNLELIKKYKKKIKY